MRCHSIRNLDVWPAASFSVESIMAQSGVRGAAPRQRSLVRNRTSSRIRSTSLECNLVLCPIIKFRGVRRFVSGHLLGVLEPAAVFQLASSRA